MAGASAYSAGRVCGRRRSVGVHKGTMGLAAKAVPPEGVKEMVTFDICKGNPGALAFVMEAYERDMFTAEQCFQRMERAGITGDKLYMLWNDCCGRDVGLALETMMCMPTPEIVRHINYEQGRGLPITKN